MAVNKFTALLAEYIRQANQDGVTREELHPIRQEISGIYKHLGINNAHRVVEDMVEALKIVNKTSSTPVFSNLTQDKQKRILPKLPAQEGI